MDGRSALPRNTILGDSYRIERVIGSGGFGITYAAEDINLGTMVAVKEYYPEEFGDRDATMSVRPKTEKHKATFEWGRTSFLQEARMLARFKHPGIVQVTRVFEAHATAYMVMSLEQGRSFETWLRGLDRPPTQEELDPIVSPLLDALETMHAENFLHRDIAPDNIIVRTDGSPVLLDFGAARRAVAERSRTLTGIVKAGYSPHEQYATDGRLQGPWSDLYAFGATLYRAVARQPPEESTLRVTDDRMPSAAQATKGTYRPRFLAAIDTCLKVKPAERPQSVAQLRPMLFAEAQPVTTAGKPPARRWLAIAATLAIAGGIYGGFEYTRWNTNERQRLEAEAKYTAEQETKRQADAVAAKRKADEEALARAKTEAEAKRREEERLAAEKRAAEERARQEAETKAAPPERPALEPFDLTLRVPLGRVVVGSKERARLGAKISAWDAGSRWSVFGEGVRHGVLVAEASANGPAAAAGLRPLDLITQMDSTIPNDRRHFMKLVEDRSPGATIELRIRRLAGSTTEVLEGLHRLAERDSDAQSLLAALYGLGIAVRMDPALATRWNRKAAEAGDAQSMSTLGFLLEKGIGVAKDQAEAVRWYRKAAEAGHAEGMYNLGVALGHGLGVAKDEAEAVRWYRKAAEAGNEWGMAKLGVVFMEGRGVAEDDAEAVRWHRKAAEAGDAGAMFNLGRSLDNGRGTAKDPKAAARWMLKALHDDYDLINSSMRTARTWSAEFRRELQRLMKEEGLYSGPINGEFGGAAFRAALDKLKPDKEP